MSMRVGVRSAAWHLVPGGCTPPRWAQASTPCPHNSSDGAQPWGFSIGLGVRRRLWAGMH